MIDDLLDTLAPLEETPVQNTMPPPAPVKPSKSKVAKKLSFKDKGKHLAPILLPPLPRCLTEMQPHPIVPNYPHPLAKESDVFNVIEDVSFIVFVFC